MLAKTIKKMGEDENSLLFWVYILCVYTKKNYLLGPVKFFFMVVYSYYLSYKLFGVSLKPKVCFRSGLFRVKLVVAFDSNCTIESGLLFFEKWRSGVSSSLSVGSGGQIEIGGSFSIGDNCKIVIAPAGTLIIGGATSRQSSGITSDCIILCHESVEIGCETIISWGCYISDSSQHKINGSLKIAPVFIGHHVWVSEGVTCAPGSGIADGVIVGAKSYVNKKYPESVFIAGCPAKIKQTAVSWER